MSAPQKLLAGLGLALVTFLYVALKLEALGLSDTDENIYFYGIKLVLEGQVPYRDFFFAHPPLHLLVPALPLGFTGFSLGFLKAVPLLASLVSGLALFDSARRAGGLVAAFATLLLFWTALEQLQASSNLTGVNLTVAFIALSLWSLVLGRSLQSGVFAGLAFCTGVYSAALLPVLLLVTARVEARRLPRLLAGMALAVLPLHLAFLLLAGPEFLTQVYGYHLAKPPRSGGFLAPGLPHMAAYLLAFGTLLALVLRGRRWWPTLALGLAFLASLPAAQVLTGHEPLTLALGNLGTFVRDPVAQRMAYQHLTLLFLAGLALPAWLLLGRGRPFAACPWARALPLTGFLGLLIFLFQFTMLRETFTFYYLLLILPAALAGGAVVGWLVGGLVQAVRGLGAPATRRPSLVRLGLVAGLLGLALLSLPAAKALGRHRFPEEARAAGQQRCYPWRQSFDSHLSGLVKALFWRECRTVGAVDPAIPRFLWNKKNFFSTAPEIAAYIKANSDPGETLAGASTIAPLLALLADRRLSGDLIDTNARRFKTGSLDWPAFWTIVCAQPVRFLVAAPNTFMSPRALAANPVVRQWFKVDKVFVDRELTHSGEYPLVLFKRVAPPVGPAGPWCLPSSGPANRGAP